MSSAPAALHASRHPVRRFKASPPVASGSVPHPASGLAVLHSASPWAPSPPVAGGPVASASWVSPASTPASPVATTARAAAASSRTLRRRGRGPRRTVRFWALDRTNGCIRWNACRHRLRLSCESGPATRCSSSMKPWRSSGATLAQHLCTRASLPAGVWIASWKTRLTLSWCCHWKSPRSGGHGGCSP